MKEFIASDMQLQHPASTWLIIMISAGPNIPDMPLIKKKFPDSYPKFSDL
jgi:hypothetical protein